MTVIGCIGHQALNQSTESSVGVAIAEILARHTPDALVGLTSLAIGADQLFARAVLLAGGRLHAVIPSADYVSTFPAADDKAAYTYLLSAATNITQLPYPNPAEEAFLAGGRAVVNGCNLLVAVWDGKPAAGVGGTGDVVAYARKQGKAVEVIWPEGASCT